MGAQPNISDYGMKLYNPNMDCIRGINIFEHQVILLQCMVDYNDDNISDYLSY